MPAVCAAAPRMAEVPSAGVEPVHPGSYDLSEAAPARSSAGSSSAAAISAAAAAVAAAREGGVDAFREQIHTELKHSGAFDRIRALVLEHARATALDRGSLGTAQQSSRGGPFRHQSDADLDILRHVLAEVSAGGGDGAASRDQHGTGGGQVPVPRSDRHYLQVDVFGAKAFAMSLLQLPATDDDAGGGGGMRSPKMQSLLVLHMHYKGQRSLSLPVALAAEPAFDESVLFDVGPVGPGAPEAEYADILAGSEPLQLALMR